MSDLDWDADDFEPAAVEKTPGGDKWQGEDDGVKDSWDDSEGSQEGQDKAFQVKKKKPLKDRIAEKQAQQVEEKERKKKEEEEARRKTSPEAILAEKLRRQKIQEDADLELAKEAFGVTENSHGDGEAKIDTFHPVTKDDFETFQKLLKDKITKYESSGHYVGFLETLYRDLALTLEADDIKKLGSTLTTLSSEKLKVSKAGKSKKPKQKAKLNSGKGGDTQLVDDDGGYNDMEDFI